MRVVTVLISREHFKDHLDEAKHTIAVFIEYKEVYCHNCKDYVYDSAIEFVTNLEKNRGILLMQHLRNPDATKTSFTEWTPSLTDSANISKHSTRTCFMSTILQSYIHNPLLRNYFLSDQHNRAFCQVREKTGLCMACELDHVVAQVFSGNIGGVHSVFTPSQFLYSMWKQSDTFAGYEQQDAHEFLIASLNGIHSHLGGGLEQDCSCVVHQIYSGLLQSQITCSTCGGKSQAFDPFLDISLDLRNTKGPDGEYEPTSLLDCLISYITPERLGEDQKISCESCKSPQLSTKQLSFSILPRVLCFHLKRFEYVSGLNGHKGTSTKINCSVDFPALLDMSPFLTHRIGAITSSPKKRKQGEQLPQSDSVANAEVYELFCVICHTGRMDSGHYIAYVRQRNQWYKCDDATITKVSLRTVLDSKGYDHSLTFSYLLFYIRRFLEYAKDEVKK